MRAALVQHVDVRARKLPLVNRARAQPLYANIRVRCTQPSDAGTLTGDQFCQEIVRRHRWEKSRSLTISHRQASRKYASLGVKSKSICLTDTNQMGRLDTRRLLRPRAAVTSRIHDIKCKLCNGNFAIIRYHHLCAKYRFKLNWVLTWLYKKLFLSR